MNYARIVPPDTFLSEYIHMCSPLETPLAYDFWTAMWALGTCLGRGVYIPRPHAPVYMNWYTMLVSESGVTRKSTSIRLARDVVAEVLGGMRLLEGRTTPEHLFDRLMDTPHMAIVVSELVTFLGRESYVIELPAMLTDLYDCPKHRTGGTVARGRRVLEDAFVTFMSASTPSWLVGAVNPSVIEGGFTSRCVFVHAEKPKQKVPWPTEASSVTQCAERLRVCIERAQSINRIELLPAAMRRYQTWYRARDTVTSDPFLASYYGREDSHVLRLAACLAINDGTLAISLGHVNTAIRIMTVAKANALQVFSARGASVRIAQGLDRVIRMLLEAGAVGVPHTPMYASVRHYMSAEDFRIVVEYMHELGMLSIGIEGRMVRGVVGCVLDATSALTGPRDARRCQLCAMRCSPDHSPRLCSASSTELAKRLSVQCGSWNCSRMTARTHRSLRARCRTAPASRCSHGSTPPCALHQARRNCPSCGRTTCATARSHPLAAHGTAS